MESAGPLQLIDRRMTFLDGAEPRMQQRKPEMGLVTLGLLAVGFVGGTSLLACWAGSYMGFDLRQKVRPTCHVAADSLSRPTSRFR